MTIVVGYLPTPEGEAALAAAMDEARRRHEPVRVLNVGRDDSSRDDSFLDEAEVDRLEARIRAAGITGEVRQLVRGKEPAEEIVEVAEQLGAGLVVIGLRRRTPTGKLLFGSQAQRVLLDARCPVLAVKASD
jgi:nucleotide-binding universal stress UspA family protein